MKKIILLPTDFSDNAWSAVVYALKLYANEYCTFYFLNSTYISESVSRTYITTHYVDEQRKLAEKSLIELKVQTEITNANANHSFETIISDEELKIAVKHAIDDYNINIVVMGTKGTTDAIEYFLGSNTIKVIKKIKKCPVLIIPNAHEFVEPKQIAFPSDYNRLYDFKELRPLKKMADLFNSKISVVHVDVEGNFSANQDYNLTMLRNYLSDYQHSIHLLPEHTTISKVISAFLKNHDIDMLAMVNYQHGLFEKILNEPVIKKLAFHPTVPILVMSE